MSDEFKVQWSISLPPSAQYAKGDMLNLRGDTVEEVEQIFDSVLSGEFVQKAAEVSATLRAAAVVTEGLAAPDAPAPEVAQASGGATVVRVCPHGKRVRREGKSGKGPWVGWFCPLPKGDASQCAPDWE